LAKGPKDTGDRTEGANVDQDVIRELAKLLDETGLTEIEFERGGMRVRIARQSQQIVTAVAPSPASVAASSASIAEALAGELAKHAGMVPSPMVGTAYLSPEPGARPYVEVGSQVLAGQTVLIIEAMKTMNQIPAPRSGRVVQILVEDAQPVEFGEPLMIIE
jgi:acetyl-CoA carboxylase biotin carboxyl carrier protein